MAVNDTDDTDNTTPPSLFQLADPDDVRRWLTDDPAELLIDPDYDPVTDTFNDGTINIILDGAAKSGLLTGPAGWCVRFHFALDDDGKDASVMWSVDHEPTALRVATGWRPIRHVNLQDRSGVDAVFGVLELGVAEANECLDQLDRYTTGT
jgi:hypothetical protein